MYNIFTQRKDIFLLPHYIDIEEVFSIRTLHTINDPTIRSPDTKWLDP